MASGRGGDPRCDPLVPECAGTTACVCWKCEEPLQSQGWGGRSRARDGVSIGAGVMMGMSSHRRGGVQE